MVKSIGMSARSVAIRNARTRLISCASFCRDGYRVWLLTMP